MFGEDLVMAVAGAQEVSELRAGQSPGHVMRPEFARAWVDEFVSIPDPGLGPMPPSWTAFTVPAPPVPADDKPLPLWKWVDGKKVPIRRGPMEFSIARDLEPLGRFTTRLPHLKPMRAWNVTYKRGWRVRLIMLEDHDAFYVNVTYKAADSDSPDRHNVDIAAQRMVAWMPDETRDDILRRLRDAIIDIETHEVDEWLRVDGKRIQEPHPSDW
jgi:hypothetical protein